MFLFTSYESYLVRKCLWRIYQLQLKIFESVSSMEKWKFVMGQWTFAMSCIWFLCNNSLVRNRVSQCCCSPRLSETLNSQFCQLPPENHEMTHENASGTTPFLLWKSSVWWNSNLCRRIIKIECVCHSRFTEIIIKHTNVNVFITKKKQMFSIIVHTTTQSGVTERLWLQKNIIWYNVRW